MICLEIPLASRLRSDEIDKDLRAVVIIGNEENMSMHSRVCIRYSLLLLTAVNLSLNDLLEFYYQ